LVDPLLVSDRRLAASELEAATLTTSFLDKYESFLGTPDEDGSFSARLADLENAFITAASRPDAVDRLNGAILAARDLISTLKTTSDGIQQERSRADRSIDNGVKLINDSLKQVEELNVKIASSSVRGQDATALMDHRQAVLDDIGKLIPIRIDERSNNRVAVFATGGAVLLDGTASELEFSPTTIVTPYQTLDAGTLSGLSLNGFPIDSSSETSPVRGGELMAHFAVRDTMAVDAQSQLDAFARDLVERFADPAVDPTLAVGDPGLFTDAGAAFVATDEVGLASRLSLNASVDPALGGEAWRLRDGVNAAVPGNAGDASLLRTLSDTLSAERVPVSGTFGSGAFSSRDLAASMLSQVGAERLQADRRKTFAQTQFNELRQLELAQGVDTDAELKNMLLIEQAYAANARLIQAADEMMQQILRI
jgi:flagellar hook-associated protein 1 FlgK